MRRRERRIANEVDRRLRKQWLLSQADDEGRICCEYCKVPCSVRPKKYGNEYAATVDHKMPLSRGGKDWPTNWAVACNRCNNTKGSMTDQQYMRFLERHRIEREARRELRREVCKALKETCDASRPQE